MTLWVATSALEQVAIEAGVFSDLETGGMLLGYWRGDEAVVTEISGPGPDARRGTTWFDPDQEWQTRLLADVYLASGRVTTYLGDWHTHPGGSPRPSRRDRRTMRAVRRAPQARQPRPLMAIVGPEPTSAPVFWLLAGRRKVHALPFREFGSD